MLDRQPDKTAGVATLMRFLVSKNLVVLLSQAFVSGTNFFTAMIVGNACGADGLGYYALGFSILIFANGFQSALVSIPYTVFYLAEEPQRRSMRATSSMLTHVALVSSICVVVLLASFVLMALGYVREALIGFALLFAAPCFVTREFARRMCFANEDYLRALRIDASTSIIQLAVLVLLGFYGYLSPSLALACTGVGCLISTLGFAFRKISDAEFSRKRFSDDVRKDWRFGKWLLLEQLFTITSSYSMPWLLAFYLNSVSVGIFAACFTIAGLANPFLQAIGSYSLPTFARLVSSGDRIGLTREIRWITAFTVAIMTVFFVVCLAFGETLLQLVFRNPEFAGHGMIVGILAVRAVLGSFGLTAHYYLLAVERPKISLYASVASIAAMVVAGVYLIPNYELVGAAVAWAIGTFVESLIMLVGYFSARLHINGLEQAHA